MEKIGLYTYPVSPFNVDFTGHLNLMNLMNFLLESAGRHAMQRGFGLEQLQQQNKSWVLSRVRIDLTDLPLHGNPIEIETWVDNVSGFFSTRKFNILDDLGGIQGSAATSWALIDIATRRPQDVRSLINVDYEIPDKYCMSQNPQKLPSTHTADTLMELITVKYSDLDINQHVNSVRYVQWVLDQFPIKKFKTSKIKCFEINYLAEVVYGDKLQLHHEYINSENMFLIEFRNANTLKTVCRSRICFEPHDNIIT